NQTKARIIKESPLIEVYKNTRIQFERMFCLDHRTIRHSPPRMRRTFELLAAYMRNSQTNTYVRGRKSAYSVPDAMEKGMHAMMTAVHLSRGDDGEWVDVLDEDELEVEDDGDLDI
ncbi:hypothetical protein PLICRDRAFT_114375, partial [Plicaturopsis crispa FD-325 SS-3]